MQGTQRRIRTMGDEVRIIPAYAGNTKYGDGKLSEEEDHPCECREYLAGVLADYAEKGSPLHMQGKPAKTSTSSD